MRDSADASISGLTIIGSLPDDRGAHGGIIAHEVRNVSIHYCDMKVLEFTGIWLSQAVKVRVSTIAVSTIAPTRASSRAPVRCKPAV